MSDQLDNLSQKTQTYEKYQEQNQIENQINNIEHVEVTDQYILQNEILSKINTIQDYEKTSKKASQDNDQTVKKKLRKLLNSEQKYSISKQFNFHQNQVNLNNVAVCHNHFLPIKTITEKNLIIKNNFLEETVDIFHIKKMFYRYNACFQSLKQKNYTIVKYLESGGQADVFEGYFQNDQGEQEECVFKFYQDASEQDFENEINIMNQFKESINIVKIIDQLKVEKVFILILEKCQYSLKYELEILKKENVFSINKLLSIIFDLLDGLIQLRIYNIVHLDIKPGNILFTKEGIYCYTDFGTSNSIKKKKKISVGSCTLNYASPEQLGISDLIDFKSDIYSLGITFEKVIAAFEQINQGYQQSQICTFQLIQQFKQIIENSMKQYKRMDRLDVENIHKQFLEKIKIEEYMTFFQNYQKKLIYAVNTDPYDDNKDTPYFINLKQMQCQVIMLLAKHNKNTNLNDQLFLHHQVANSYLQIGDDENSLKYFLKFLEMMRENFKENHPSIATSMNNVEQLQRSLSINENGVENASESLDMMRQVFKGNHAAIASSLNNIGKCYYNLDDNENGLEYFLESLEMRRQFFTGNHPDIATSLNNVGACYLNLGDNENGLKYFLESLDILRQIFQGNHPDIANSLNNVGTCYMNIGDNENGLKYSQESLDMTRQIYKANHPDNTTSLICWLEGFQDLLTQADSIQKKN